VDRVSAIDSFTVRFTMRPHIEPLTGLAFLPVMPAHALDSIPPVRLAQAAFNRAPVGNGPFRFVEHRPNERWTFEANPDFRKSWAAGHTSTASSGASSRRTPRRSPS
jgi:ABC-type oligopeptide transport system substrate-binding subunit